MSKLFLVPVIKQLWSALRSGAKTDRSVPSASKKRIFAHADSTPTVAQQSHNKVKVVFYRLVFLFFLGAASSAQAGEFCSAAPFNGTIDGTNAAHLAALGTQITIDTDCTFLNFPASNPLTVTLNFQTNDPSVYLITFDNVVFTGNMACANIDHRIWFVNGADYGSKNSCQDLFIPVEAINKQNPVGKTTVGIGEPFTYTLRIPVLYDPVTSTYINNAGSANDLHTITITDDLNATGADLSLVSTPTVTWSGSGAPVAHTFTSNDGGVDGALRFEIDPGVIIPAGQQIEIAITVVADDTNAIGTQFFNTAKWSFGRLINIDLDGDGIPEPNYFSPLPGENGVTEPMTIGGPDLVVTKTSPDTALNVGATSTFTIDVQNNGGSGAWQATILDQLPAGMCDYLATPAGIGSVTAQVFAADGVTPVSAVLNPGVDYTVSYTGDPTCQLSLDMLTTNAVIGPTERLVISYDNQLDGVGVVDGSTHTNIAGATQWYSGDGVYNRIAYTRTLSDPLNPLFDPNIADHEDIHTITAALTGYIFQKTVQNLTTGEYPGTTAAPGDRLRYRVRLYNFSFVINDVSIKDVLNPAHFDLNSFNMLTLPNGVADYTFDNISGLLQIAGDPYPATLNLVPPQELVLEFEINLATGLANGITVENQAELFANGDLVTPYALSDDPFVNGIAAPTDTGDSTDIVIQAPGALSKANGQATASIGEQFTYTITVPANPVDVPLYDVRILDDLSAASADLGFVSASVLAGGSWSLSNTGTATALVIEDSSTGIDIPANAQAVIAITVQLQNTLTNQAGLVFNNTATYTYNRANGDSGTQTAAVGASTANMTVLEPNISSISKTANNATPTAGETIRYSVTLSADGGANNSDVFDVTFIDNLDLGLAYVGNPTVTVGAGVSADNSISAPDITGDGITTAQTLVWGVIEADIDIVAGASVTIEYDVQVLDTVLANQVLNNNVVAQWTSIDGSISGERTGADGIGALNDYVTAPATVALTTPDLNATIAKVRSTDTYGAADDNVRIGDIVDYTLTLSVPEGTLGNVQLVDTLPQGLDFEAVVSINGITAAPYTAVAPFTHADIVAANVIEVGDPSIGSTTVTWNLGNLTNLPNDGANNDFVIVYRARVLNNVFPHANLTLPVNNTVTLSYDKATGTVTQSDNDTVITALQPSLAVSKFAVPAGGDIFITAAELVTYTVEVVNNGTAPAYDLVLQDIIPIGMRNGAATITMVSTTLGGVGVADVVPVYDAVTGVATWDFDNGIADAYTIDAGETLTLVYQVQADAAIGQGLILTNASQASTYYSFDDEAVPTQGTVTGVREVYGPSNIATTTLYTSAPPTKALISPPAANPEATIGEEIIYQLMVPGNVSASTLYDVQITDVLDANLELLSANVTGGIGVADSSTATQLDMTVTEIPAGQQVAIELRTRLRNVLGAQQSVDINNTVSYSYAFTPGGSTQPVLASSDIVTINIIEPHISTVTINANNMTPTAGDIVRYSLTLNAVGGTDSADVFDVAISDSLSLGLVYEGNPTVSVGGGVSADNTIAAPIVTGDGIAIAQTLVWSLANANADIDIEEGTPVTIAFDVRVLNNVLANQVLSSSVVAQWTGIDAASIYERDGSDGIGGLNDYITAPVTHTLNTPNLNATINKVRNSDTYGAADDNVRIGDIAEYTLTLSVPEGTLGNLQIVDTLPQGLDFEEIVSINGINSQPYSAVAPFVHGDIVTANVVEAGDPALGSTTVTWNIGDLSNQPNDSLNNDFVIIYRARVLNNVFPHANLNIPLNNLVSVSYDTASGTVSNSDIDTIITALQPQLTVSKAAAPAGGDNIIVANELVTYTVNVTNGGTAPAYDLLLEDIIPVGMRNGAATITMVSTTLAGNTVADVAPLYNPLTGVITWNFDSGVADAYTIGVAETLTVVYQVQADANVSAGITLANAARGLSYYSFDNDAEPVLGGVTGVREVYGPTNTAVVTLNSTPAGALDKANPADLTVAVGETFTYRISVPATPIDVALYDVRIVDDLSASAADLSFVSVTKVSGSLPWTPVNTGSITNLVIEDSTDGIDIPVGEQVVIDITVQVDDTATNVSGLTFSNTATYTFNQFDNNPATQQNGLPDTTADMTIVGPDNLTLEKSGPPTMRLGVPGTFYLNVHNTGTAAAYDLVITDQIPNPVPGGMCDVAPNNFTAQIYLADGVTAVGAALVENTDFNVNFVPGTPTCTLSFTMLSPAAAIPADYRLIISYDVSLDSDSPNNTTLTNIAAAELWYGGDTAGAGATGQIRTYSRTLTDGTPGVLDHEDAYTVLTESPIIQFQKYVINTTTGQDPGSNASPGDTLRYRIVATNVSPVDVPVFSIIDEVDRLNNPAVFVPGSLNIVSVPPGADVSNSDPNGGTFGTGILDVRNLSMSVAGGGNDSVTVEFEVTLAAVIDSGTVVMNQALLQIYNLTPQPSDDPNINGIDDSNIIGDEDPTQTLIASAPWFQVQKTSDDLTGSPAVLLPGDTLRYTITVKNIGNENAVNTRLQDTIPDNTTYIAATTTLNGVTLTDPTPGVSPLESGVLINAPENTTTGYMRADADAAVIGNVATITFDVMINQDAINGTIISNQGYVYADGVGNSGAITPQPSDDPDTAVADDPTRDVVGSLPLVDALKTVALYVDNGTPGIVDPGDVLRYTITVSNSGAVNATGVTLTDAVPADTTYVADSVYLNGLPVGQPDAGVSPLVAGIAISSQDLTPPVPDVGYLSPGQSAIVTFDVMVNAGTAPGTVISNQGFVDNNELPVEPTDADGLDANGDQPTLIVVGNAQQLSITKAVSVVGGGPAVAGGQLEYIVRVTNVSTVPAYDVTILDDLDDPVPGQMTYVSGSATLNGLPNGIVYTAPTFTVDYANTYGQLQPGEVAEFRFRVMLDAGLAIGETVTNVAQVYWNAATQTASASVSIDIGAMPGVANLNGQVWHDANFDNAYVNGERGLEDWNVEIYFKGNLLDTVTTDANGEYQINSLAANYYSSDRYELRFVAPSSGPNTAKLGRATSVFTNDMYSIRDIIVYPGNNLQNLNLPLTPNGVVYDSIVRVPVAGARVTMLRVLNQANRITQALPASCFDDPAQQNQVTLSYGYYKFDLNFSQPDCPSAANYLIQVTPPPTGYVVRDANGANESEAIPPSSNLDAGLFSVPGCAGGVDDAVPTTPNHCEAQDFETSPPTSFAPGTTGTSYYMHMTLADVQIPQESELYNNHIPLDPQLAAAVSISKVSTKVNVTRGELVPYTIVVRNTLVVPLDEVSIVDNFPAGFKYVPGSARLNGAAVEPQINGLQLRWDVASLGVEATYTLQLLLVVGAGVQEGEYVNRAHVFSNQTQGASGEASATVRVVPDPTFDCSDVIGKVFDDKNLNGYQDEGEAGIPGVRLATARGLLITSDAHGRFHLTCAAVPNELRGSNFILKLDERSLPSGFRVTSENPRVERLTRGKAARFNFGATVHRVVTLDLADDVFETDATQLRPQWEPRLQLLLKELQKAPSLLRLSYLADVEPEGLVKARLEALKKRLIQYWDQVDRDPLNRYQLSIETEVFWRHGVPVSPSVSPPVGKGGDR